MFGKLVLCQYFNWSTFFGRMSCVSSSPTSASQWRHAMIKSMIRSEIPMSRKIKSRIVCHAENQGLRGWFSSPMIPKWRNVWYSFCSKSQLLLSSPSLSVLVLGSFISTSPVDEYPSLAESWSWYSSVKLWADWRDCSSDDESPLSPAGVCTCQGIAGIGLAPRGFSVRRRLRGLPMSALIGGRDGVDAPGCVCVCVVFEGRFALDSVIKNHVNTLFHSLQVWQDC